MKWLPVIMLFIGLMTAASALTGPGVIRVEPGEGATNVPRDVTVRARVYLPIVSRGLDRSTVNSESVRLYPAGSPSVTIDANVVFKNQGRDILVRPSVPLAANTPYVFHVSDRVRHVSGRPVTPFTFSFRTGALPTTSERPDIAFEATRLDGTEGLNTRLVVGPDGKLYAARIDGIIRRWTIGADGSLTDPEEIRTLWDVEGESRLLVGLAFDPLATADDLVAWASHSTFGFANMSDWGGKITRLSGPNLEQAEDYVVNLPRSTRDHVTNGIAFGPDGALYVSQGSNTSTGDPDAAWGHRPERLLTAAILRADLRAIEEGDRRPLDVKTEEGGTYDPYAEDAPVRIFAGGVRNAYSMVWHSNGYLYVPNNGAAPGGRTPESIPGMMRPDGRPYAGPPVPPLEYVGVQDDHLFRISPPGADGKIAYRYLGHPNPSRGEFVLNGGNPTSLLDPGQVAEYEPGVMPDEAWGGYEYNFGKHVSPNGIIEYRSDASQGALRGHLLIAFYSPRSSGHVLVLRVDGRTGEVSSDADVLGIPGLSGFNSPLDLTEDPATGYVYVSEFGEGGRIVLLRPAEGAPRPFASREQSIHEASGS